KDPPVHDPQPPDDHHPKTHTDLPLLPGGNNGNASAARTTDAVANIERLFAEAVQALPVPPISLLSTEAVVEWIERATANLEFRRERHRLLREALRALERDFRSAIATEQL